MTARTAQAHRQTDALVAQALGWTVQPWIGPVSGHTYFKLVDPQGNERRVFESAIAYDTEAQAWSAVPQFSTDIAAVWTLVEYLRTAGWYFSVADISRDTYEASFYTHESGDICRSGATAPAAITAAFLAAVAVRGEASNG
jgi:hypothetical protein